MGLRHICGPDLVSHVTEYRYILPLTFSVGATSDGHTHYAIDANTLYTSYPFRYYRAFGLNIYHPILGGRQ